MPSRNRIELKVHPVPIIRHHRLIKSSEVKDGRAKRAENTIEKNFYKEITINHQDYAAAQIPHNRSVIKIERVSYLNVLIYFKILEIF